MLVRIEENRSYWLIRTDAGEYYDEFYHDNFVSIGWDELNQYSKEDLYNDVLMDEVVQKAYGEKVKQPWRVYKQLRRFVHEIAVGDIVIIPSKSHVSFGEVKSEVEYFEVSESKLAAGLCPFQKRRKVEWIKTVRREELDPYLYRLLNSHFTVTNANEYSSYIDRTLHSFYVKGDKAHLVLQVTTHEEIYAKDLLKLINGTLNLADVYNELSSDNVDTNDVEIKLNVQSPGPIEFISNVWTITAIGVLLVFIVGGKFTFKKTKESTDISAESEGLIEKLLKVYQNVKQNKELNHMTEKQTKETIEKLEVELPEELKKLPEFVQGE